MADNIVVIGQGKMIANTSIGELLAGSAHSGVFVRSKNNAKLEAALKEQGISYQKGTRGLQIVGKQSDEIGIIAFKAGVAVLELSNQKASLEEAFLELTADSTEYTNRPGESV